MKWYSNIVLITALLGWFGAQFIKIVIMLIKNKKIDLKLLFSTGGMPSAHSSMVTALSVAVGFQKGFGSALFAASAVFASVIMFDAQGVRKAAGEQAKIVNQILEELFNNHHLSNTKLKELLGHTRFEVLVGLILGTLIAVGMYFLFN